MSEEKNKQDGHIDPEKIWEDAKENVTEGAKYITQEARELGKQISTYSEVLFGKIKDKSGEVLKYGLNLTEEGVNKAQKAAESLREDAEMKKLNKRKKEVASQLGMKFYLLVKNNGNHVPRDLISNKDILSLMKELEDIDKEILDLSK